MSGRTSEQNQARLVRCSAGCGTLVWLKGALPVAADADFVCPNCMTGAELIAAERRRQVDVEGYTVEHDVVHESNGELATAAWAYLADLVTDGDIDHHEEPEGWPWPAEWRPAGATSMHPSWKPTPDDPIRQLVKAGALIAAEIDRRKACNEATA
jgi:hypothetical protein